MSAVAAAALLLLASAPASAAAPTRDDGGHHRHHHHHHHGRRWRTKCHDKGILGFFSPLLWPHEATICDGIQYPHLL